MVKIRKPFLIAACFVLVAGFCTFSVKADDWNKATIITTNVPIEVPGRILPAGKYMFRLMDSIQDRHIVEIMSGDQTKLYERVLGIPDYRLEATDNAKITFGEAPAGGVAPVKEWFYAGERSGIEFVYPKHRGVALAVTSQNISTSDTTVTEESTVTKEEPAPEAIAEATPGTESEPTEVSEVAQVAQNEQPATPQATSPAPEQPKSDTDDTPAALPKTASPDDLLLLIGLGSAFTAFGIRRFRS